MGTNANMVDIFISDEMRSILNQFKSNSLVASLLLSESINEDNLVKDYVNYVSVSKDDVSKISYLSNERYRVAIERGQDPWTTGHRYHVRPGAFINKIFKNIPAKEIEIFSMLWKLHNKKSNFNFSIAEGNNIKRWYFYDNYLEQSGSLGNSCMKHEVCQSFFPVYTQNKGTIRLLIMTCAETDYLIGRALLWEFDGNKVLDRIYTINDEEYSHHFKIWADKNGYMYKVEQKWNNTTWFMNAGNKVNLKLKVKLDNFVFERYPYVDTFKFLDFETGYAYNYKPEEESKIRTLCASDGRFLGHDYLDMDVLDGLYYHRGEIVTLRYRGLKVHHSKTLNSNINGGIQLLKEDSIHIKEISDYIFNEKYNEFNNIEQIKRKVKGWRDTAISDTDVIKQVIDMISALNKYIKLDNFDDIIKELKECPIKEKSKEKSSKVGEKKKSSLGSRFSNLILDPIPQYTHTPSYVVRPVDDEMISEDAETAPEEDEIEEMRDNQEFREESSPEIDLAASRHRRSSRVRREAISEGSPEIVAETNREETTEFDVVQADVPVDGVWINLQSTPVQISTPFIYEDPHTIG